MGFTGQKWILCSALVRSGGDRGCGGRVFLGFGLGFGSGLARNRFRSRLALRQVNSKRGAAALFAGYGNVAVMVADYRLNDGKAQAGAHLLGRVIRSEEALAFLRSEAFAGIRDFDANVAVVF